MIFSSTLIALSCAKDRDLRSPYRYSLMTLTVPAWMISCKIVPLLKPSLVTKMVSVAGSYCAKSSPRLSTILILVFNFMLSSASATAFLMRTNGEERAVVFTLLMYLRTPCRSLLTIICTTLSGSVEVDAPIPIGALRRSSFNSVCVFSDSAATSALRLISFCFSRFSPSLSCLLSSTSLSPNLANATSC